LTKIFRSQCSSVPSAFQWLEEAYRQRVWRIIELTLPMFDSLRADDRWHELALEVREPRIFDTAKLAHRPRGSPGGPAAERDELSACVQTAGNENRWE
jgi:hypothetical protein